MSDVWNFLVDHGDTILTAITVVSGFIYHQIRGDQKDTIRATVKTLAQRIVHTEGIDLDDPAVELKVRQLIESLIGQWLVDHKVPPSLAQVVITEAVEIGLTELHRLMSQNRALTAAVSDMTDAATRVEKAFTPPANPTVPKLDPSMFDVTITPPDVK